MRAIGPPLTPAERDAFIAAARACVGVKFRHMGRHAGVGLDCSGLLVWAMRQVPRPVQDTPAYGRDPHMDGLRNAVEANLGPAVPEPPQAGDVVLMAFSDEPRHIGLIGDHPQGGLLIIHAWVRAKKVVEHRFDDAWLKQVSGKVMAVFRP